MTDDDKALDEAAALAAPFEGLMLRPYQDPAGHWTIGFGATRDAFGDPVAADTPPISRSGALALFRRDLKSALEAVQHDVHVPLTVEEESALTTFVLNVGATNFARSTLLRMLNRGEYELCASQFDLWVHAGGRVLAGLVRRRAAERKLFESSTP